MLYLDLESWDGSVRTAVDPLRPLHQRIRQTVNDYINHSYDSVVSRRHQDFNRAERYWYAEVDWDEIDYMKRQGIPTFEDPIVLPALHTMLSSHIAALFQLWRERRPPFVLRARNSGQALKVKQAEALINWQAQKTRIDKVQLYRYIATNLYGYAPVKIRWDKNQQSTIIEPWDVYQFFWDPYTSIDDLQSGQFVGFQSTQHILALERAGLYWNLDKLKAPGDMYLRRFGFGVERGDSRSGTQRDELHGLYEPDEYRTRGIGVTTHIIKEVAFWMTPTRFFKGLPEMQWLLKVGQDPDEPVIAFATIANGETVIGFHYLDLPLLPSSAIAIMGDGHTVAPRGLAQMNFGVQKLADWLINSNIEEVRRNVYGIWVYDESRIRGLNLATRRHGMNIPVRKQIYGQAVADSIHQLAVQETTAGFIDKALQLLQFTERDVGASEPVQGASVQRQGKRTATEIDTLVRGAAGRYGMLAGLFDEQDSETLVVQMYEFARRYMDQAFDLKLTADIAAMMKSDPTVDTHFTVRPGDFDDVEIEYVPFDPKYLAQRERSAETKMQLLQTILSIPQLAQRIDVLRFIKSVAADLGEVDFDQFIVDQPGPTEPSMAQQQQSQQQPAGGPPMAPQGGQMMPPQMVETAPPPIAAMIPMNGGYPPAMVGA